MKENINSPKTPAECQLHQEITTQSVSESPRQRPSQKTNLKPRFDDRQRCPREIAKESNSNTQTINQSINRKHASPRFSIYTRLPRERASERQKKITYTGKEEADAGTRAAATWLDMSDMCDMRAYSDWGGINASCCAIFDHVRHGVQVERASEPSR
jgi:hypothetical protein